MKAQTIYNMTMSLMDERKDNGDVDTASTKDYNARAPGILTVLQNEIALKLGIDAKEEVKALTSDVDLEDIICIGIMPYGLAGRLLAQEDATLSNYFSSLYDMYSNSYLARYKDKAVEAPVTDYYGSTLRAGD